VTVLLLFSVPDSWQHTFHVLRETTQLVLLGWDFLLKNHALLDIAHGRLQLWRGNILLLRGKDLTPVCCNVSIATAMTFHPLSEAIVHVNVCPAGPSEADSNNFIGYLEPNIPDTSNLVVAHTVTTHLGEFYSVNEADLDFGNTASGQDIILHSSTSPEKSAEIEKQVEALLVDGVIEESPWVSPVLVKKKCGHWRFCVDYRRLNSVTVKGMTRLCVSCAMHRRHSRCVGRCCMVRHIRLFKWLLASASG